METLLVKKKEYEIIENIDEYTMKVSRDGEVFIAHLLGYKTRAFSNFSFAYKRLTNCNIAVPKRRVVDKKKGIVLVDFIDGPTVYEEIADHELSDAYYQQVYILSWFARKSGITLDFSPKNFKMYDNRLFYLSYTFDVYKKDEDFSINQSKYWFYTKDLRECLISDHIKIDMKRIKTEGEINKEMVLKAVQFYK